jgi:tape measure domain-containing protein
MAKLGDLILRVGADTSKLNQGLGDARKAIAKNTAELQRLGSTMTRTITLPLAALGAGAIKSASDLETLETSFISLTGGAEQAAAMMSQLNEFTAKTPFQIDAVAKSARQLIASGTGIDEVNDQLQFLGDIAATSGSSIDEIAAIFAKVNAKGKVELENLNQLAERGIPIFTALADATGLPADALGAGAVSVEQFNETLKGFATEGGFAAGAMERLSETAAGKFSTAMDNLKLAGAELAEDLMPVVKDLIDGFTRMMQRIQTLSPETKKFGLIIAGVASAVGPLLVMIPNLIIGIKAARTAFALLNTTMLANPFGLVAAGLTVLVGAIILLTDETKEAVSAVDQLAEANKGLSLEEQKRNIEEQIAKQQEIVDGLEAERDAKQEIVDQGYGGKAINEANAANAAYKAGTDQLDKLNAMLANVNDELAKNDDGNKKAATSTNTLTLEMVKASAEAYKLQQELAKLGTQADELVDKDYDLGKAFFGKAEPNLDLAEFDFVDEVFGDEDDLAKAGDRIRATAAAAQATMQQVASNIGGFFTQTFQGVIAGTTTFKDALLEALKAIAIKLAAMIATFAVLSAFIPGFAGTVGGLKGFVGSGFGFDLPQFSNGGIVSGPTLGLVGEYPGAKTNPEVIAPLDKLRGMLGGQAVQVTGKISGRDILLTSERNAIDRNRVRGF